MKDIIDAILASDGTAVDFGALPLPESHRAVTIHEDEITLFEGMDSDEKDPRTSLRVDEVAVPELGPREALVAVMASSVNCNAVWTSIFDPVSTFAFLKRYPCCS